MANGKKELIEDISDIRRLAGLSEAPKKKAAAPANPDPNNYGSFSTNNNSPYGFARGGSDDDTAANFFASDKRMRDAQAAPAAPRASAPAGGTPPTRVQRTQGGDYPVYPKASPEAGSFRDEFRAARERGDSTFSWQGRQYGTQIAGEKPQVRPLQPQQGAGGTKGAAPKGKTGPQSTFDREGPSPIPYQTSPVGEPDPKKPYEPEGPQAADLSPPGSTAPVPIYTMPPGMSTPAPKFPGNFDLTKPTAPAPAPKVEPAPSTSAAPSDTPPQAAPITRQPEMFTDPDQSRNTPPKAQPLPPLPAAPPSTPNSGFRNVPGNIPPGSGLERQLQQQPATPAKPANPWNNRTFQPTDQPVSPPTGSFTKPEPEVKAPGNDASLGSKAVGTDFADARPSIFPHQVIKELEDMINDGEEIEEEVDAEIEECGDMMPHDDAMSHHDEQEASVNITSNFDSKSGNKTLTVSAEGEAAEQLAQILKMAGLR